MPKKPADVKLYRRVGKNLVYLIREVAETTPAAVSRDVKSNKPKVHYATIGRYCSLSLARDLAKRLGVTIDSLVNSELWK